MHGHFNVKKFQKFIQPEWWYWIRKRIEEALLDF